MLLPAPLPWLYPQLRYQPDPELEFTLRPEQKAYTADKPVWINPRGLRGPEIPFSRQKRQERILLLGDSIVFGYGVADAEDLGSRLAAFMASANVPAEVINTGVPSYNTEQEVAYLQKDGMRYAPDYVVLGVCWNDINDKVGIRVNDDGWLISAGQPDPGRLAVLAESPVGYALRNTLKRSRLAYAASQGLRVIKARLFPDDHALFRQEVLDGNDTLRVTAGWNRMAGALKHLSALSVEGKFQVLVVAFPLPIKLEGDYPRSSFPERVEAISRSAGLLYLDLEPVFRAAYHGHDSLFIPYDGDHPNAAGQDLAARSISMFLRSQSLSPPNPSK